MRPPRGSVFPLVRTLRPPAGRNVRGITWAACVSLLLAGCPASSPDSSTTPSRLPYEGAHVRLVVPQSRELADAWAPAINDWADENAADVEFVEINFAESGDAWIDTLADQPTSLVLLPTTRLGAIVGADLVDPIPPEVLDAQTSGWHSVSPALKSAVGMLGDSPAFVVVTSPTPLVVVRSDLLQAAGRQPPTTWEEYDRLVRELTDWAPQLRAVEPRADASLSTLFLARAVSAARPAAQLSVELDVSSGNPLIASQPFVRALSEMQGLTPVLSDEVRSLTPADCLQSLLDGTAAIGIVWEPPIRETAASSSATSAPPSERALQFVPLPGRTEVFDRDGEGWTPLEETAINRPALCGVGGVSVAVTNVGTATERAAAWDLWGLLARYQADGTIPSIEPGAGATTGGPAEALSPGLSSAEQQSHRQSVSESLQSTSLVCELPMSGRDELRAALTHAIARALDDQSDPQQALDAVQAEWTNIIDSIGHARVLNSYRTRLGLVPVPE